MNSAEIQVHMNSDKHQRRHMRSTKKEGVEDNGSAHHLLPVGEPLIRQLSFWFRWSSVARVYMVVVALSTATYKWGDTIPTRAAAYLACAAQAPHRTNHQGCFWTPIVHYGRRWRAVNKWTKSLWSVTISYKTVDDRCQQWRPMN